MMDIRWLSRCVVIIFVSIINNSLFTVKAAQSSNTETPMSRIDCTVIIFSFLGRILVCFGSLSSTFKLYFINLGIARPAWFIVGLELNQILSISWPIDWLKCLSMCTLLCIGPVYWSQRQVCWWHSDSGSPAVNYWMDAPKVWLQMGAQGNCQIVSL